MVPESLDIVHMIMNAGLMVQFVMLLLLFFSVTSWCIILIKSRYFKKAFNQSALFTDFFWKSRDLSEAFLKAKQLSGSPVARLFQVGYTELKTVSQSGKKAEMHGLTITAETDDSLHTKGRGIDNVKRALRRAINTEMTRTSQLVPFLATTGNTTPFIGLFGTVWGIMNSFRDIGQMGSANLAVVAPGISEALIATAAGLAAAIPAVIAYNYFTNRVRIIETELISFSQDLLNIIERDILA
jgi:biopolymer transport protein TolQ